MTDVVAWTLVFTCTVLLAKRFPAAMKGINRQIFAAGVALTTGFLLVTSQVYGWVASLTPLPNLPDLLSRIALMVSFALLGAQLAKAVGSAGAERWTVGRPGWAVFSLVLLGQIIAFTNLTGPHASPLVDDHSQPGLVAATALTAGYLAYVGMCSAWPIYQTAIHADDRVTKLSSVLILLGLLVLPIRLAVVFISVSNPNAFGVAETVTQFGAAFLVVLGLAIARHARRRSQKASDSTSVLRVK